MDVEKKKRGRKPGKKYSPSINIHKLPATLATTAVRRQRMVLIRSTMNISRNKFAAMLGVTYKTYWRWETGCDPMRQNIPLSALKCAEYELDRWRKTAKLPEPSGHEMALDTRRAALQLAAKGKSAAEICSELALSPEVVAYYLSLLE